MSQGIRKPLVIFVRTNDQGLRRLDVKIGRLATETSAACLFWRRGTQQQGTTGLEM